MEQLGGGGSVGRRVSDTTCGVALGRSELQSSGERLPWWICSGEQRAQPPLGEELERRARDELGRGGEGR